MSIHQERIYTQRYRSTTRNSSGYEIANVNFFTTTSSTTFTVTQCAPEATEFGEMTQNKGHYDVQGHSRYMLVLAVCLVAQMLTTEGEGGALAEVEELSC